MKLIIITEDFPPMAGGIAVFLSELSKGLAKRGNDVRVIVNEIPESNEYDKNQEYPIIRYSMPKRFSSVCIFWQVFRQVVRMKPDVLFLGHVMATRGLPVLLFKWVFRIPYAVLCHDGNLGIAGVSEVNRISGHKLLRHATLILANSKYTEQLLIEKGFPAEKIRILTPGVDTDFFIPSINQSAIQKIRLKYHADGVTFVINVGRLVPKKNQKNIVRAIGKLRDWGILVKCIIAGDGPENTNLVSNIDELNLDEHVSLIGPAGSEIVKKLFQAADIVILPSIIDNGAYESFGIVAIEGSACGKPIIVGSKGGQSDAVIPDVTGLIVDAEDENNIANAIAYLIRRKDIADQMGNAGRAHAVENFSWSKIAQRAATLLSEVM